MLSTLRLLAYFSVLMLLSLPGTASVEEAVPKDPIAPYLNPDLGPAVTVGNQTVAIGHLRLVMEEGVAAPVLVDDEAVGLFFTGSGTVVYNSIDPDEKSVFNYNTKHATSLTLEETESGARAHGKVNRMLLLGDLESLPGLEASPDQPATDNEAIGKAFGKHVEVFSDEQAAPGQFLLVKHALDDAKATILRAELSGPAGELCYMYDPVDRQAEALYSLRRLSGSLPKGARWPVTISKQVLGRERRAFKQPLFLLAHIDYTLTTDGKENASLDIEETIVPMGKKQRVFRFELYTEFFDQNGKPREWRLKSITDEKGRSVPFLHERDNLMVVLHEAAPPDKRLRLRFQIEGRILIRPGNNAYWRLGVLPWFPQPGLGGQYYTVHSVIKTPDPFVPIAPGTTVSRQKEGELNVLETKIDKPVQFAVALAGKYTFREETRDDIVVRIASYAMAKKSAADKLSNLAHKTIDYYEKILGPFPFKEYNVVEINSLGWGQAPPGMMFITKEAFTPWFDRVWAQGINHRFAHEIAHQYWAHVVKMGSVEEQWITEAFSEYCASFIVRQVRGEKYYRDLVAGWQDNAKVASDKCSIPCANRLYTASLTNRYDRQYLVYDKGALFLAVLHDEIGDAAMASFLRSTQQGWNWKYAETRYLPMLLERITGKDYSEMFEKYFWGTRMPRPPKVLR
jgi:hypothetical protein